MGLTEVLLSEETQRRLGEDGLEELAACLWPVDCQTCGALLGDDPPALCVDDSIVTATASLHHEGCRGPEWNDSAVIVRAAGDFVSHVTRMMLIPVATGRREAEPWPLMVVNPGLEYVSLAPAGDGRWHVEHGAGFAGAGLVRPGWGLRAGVPVGGAVARIMESSVAVSFQVPPFTVYEAPAEEEITGCARERGGVLIGVTHALHPGQLAAEDLYAVMGSGQMLAGWVGAHGAARPRPNRAARRQVCVLTWSPRHLMVGMLAGQAPARFSPDRAQAWAGRLIGREPGGPLEWEPVDPACPGDGWRVMQPFSARQFFLFRHEDGWKLVFSCSHVAGGSWAETDNEAKAWAAGVLSFRAGLTGVDWVRGPGTPGSVTLYGRAR
jgi:hypothetical protein